jgi:hypothetical protein
MPRTLHASIIVTLPEDEFAAAAMMTQIAPHWASFTRGIEEAGIKYRQELTTQTTKPRVQRRSRKDQTIAPPPHIALAPAPPDEDDAA